MKTLLITLIAGLMVAGCATQPIAMKSTTKYFAPATSTAMAKSTGYKNSTKTSSMVSAQKKINEKDTIIELLKKENKELRDRLDRLEKKLQIQNS